MRHRHPYRHRLSATALATVILGGLSLAGPETAVAARAKPATPVVVKVTQLPRGADIGVPHVEGTSVVDGSTRIPVGGADRVELLGRSGTSYVVAAFDDRGRQRVLRATAGGSVTPLLTPSRKGDSVKRSADGTRLAQTVVRKGFTSRVRVWSAADGTLLASRSFPGILSLLDLDASRVVLGGFDAGTLVWRTASDSVKTVTGRAGAVADIAADRLATLTGDPYDGGCTVVSRLSTPRSALWRSCAERVQEFSPDGRRMATVDLLSDGIGPSQVLVRGAGGASKGVYRIRGYFGQLTWESEKALLLEGYGKKQSATVRCTDGACGRATDLAPTPAFRTPAQP